MTVDISVILLEEARVAWLESEFNARWPWPRPGGFVASLIQTCTHFVACDTSGRYLGHCHIRQSTYPPFLKAEIPEIADLSVMPDSRRLGAATSLLDAAEAHATLTSATVGIGVGLYDAYGPAQRLYVQRGYVPDGTGVWSGSNNVAGGQVVEVDDDLVMYLTKSLR